MKSKINYLLLFSFLFLLFSNILIAQKIDTVSYKGNPCYVYPFKIYVKTHSYYYNTINTRKYTKLMVKLFKENRWKDLSKKEYKDALKDFKEEIKESGHSKNKNERLNKIIRANPFSLLEQRYEMNVDVKPCLDKIPDGKYIQYFSDFGLVKSKKEITVVKNKIAGVFNIKNNVLEGEAVWFNFKGDTLKKGFYKNGLKEGEWSLERRDLSNKFDKEFIEKYLKNGFPEIDTFIDKVVFHKGVMNGFYSKKGNSDYPLFEGYYTDNEYSGHWKERIMKANQNLFTKIAKQKDFDNLKHNKVVTAEYTYSKNKKTIKQPLIRDKTIGTSYHYYIKDYNFDSDYLAYNVSKDLYKIEFTSEPDLELEEEKINSYDGEELEEEYYEGDEEYFNSPEQESPYQTMVYDKATKKSLLRGKAIDSLGLTFNYEGIYERHYPNGQRMFRYEFKDGKLLKEDTIFWDNGKPLDVIIFKPDSNQFVQSIYDYDGKLYNELIFDSLGDFVRVNFEPEKKEYVFIDGLMAENNPNTEFYSYDKMDTLAHEILADSILIWKSWYKNDSTKLYERIYFPKERTLKYGDFSMTGKQSFRGEITFNEGFQSWTGLETFSFNDLTLKSNKSASFTVYKRSSEEKDTVPQLNVNAYDHLFDVTLDDVLFLKNIPVSGSVSITLNTKKAKFHFKKGLDLSFPVYTKYISKLEKDYRKYKQTGVSKYPVYLNSLDQSEVMENHTNYICNSLFPFLSANIIYPDVYLDYDNFGNIEKYKEWKNEPSAKKITGNLKDGKPEGTWIVKDQFRNNQIIIPFLNGEINGTIKNYSVAYPFSEDENFYDRNGLLSDSFPKKKTDYLSSVENYKNGAKHGESIYYNWFGEIERYENYEEGYKKGISYERNKLAFTKKNYLDGVLDGYLETYLTLPGQDSILLFDLNFQNGLLQGESKSYHLNGKLSKRGFFLNGQSIDDYEAFDSLGFKYHYVKFLYSFPVEEKIWEENELSVRYIFDWKDSINFTPTDITSSQSLDRMLAHLGIGMNYYERPYFGRPSVVNKMGINYHLTKYYPNDSVARDGEISSGKKIGLWKYYSYEGEFLYEVNYSDSIIKLNDSIQFKSKGLLTDFDSKGNMVSKSYIIEKFEKYDCSHTDHYEVRQLYTFWEANDSLKLMTGYVKNHYDNGVLQNEGYMVNGLPSGIWKFYDPFGQLNQVGKYVLGKREGRWLGGDLSKTKYLGDICLNPNLPYLEEEIKAREKQLDIIITNYKNGKALNKEFYDIDWSEFDKDIKTKEIGEE